MKNSETNMPTQPNQPKQPAQPMQPLQPKQPKQPEQPEQPMQPAQPGQSAQPAQPAQPGQPPQPAQPAQLPQNANLTQNFYMTKESEDKPEIKSVSQEKLENRARERAQYKFKVIGEPIEISVNFLDIDKLEKINNELVDNEELKNEFINSPAKFLTDRGFKLPPEMQVEFIENKESVYNIEITVGHIVLFK